MTTKTTTIREKWATTRPLYRRIVSGITLVAGIVAIYTAMNLFLGVTVRPAWAWELTAAASATTIQFERTDERNDARFDALTLRYVGMAVTVEQGNRREFSRSLNQFRALKDDYIRNGDQVPGWLTREISDGEQDVQTTDETIRSLQRELIISE